MIDAVGASSGAQYAPVSAQREGPSPKGQGDEELTTVTTHCSKQHKHTPACPHTAVTRPANPFEGTGRYLDVLA